MAQSSQAFQGQVNVVPAPGVEGDFASLNPFFMFPAGPGGLVAGNSLITGGVGGILVGRFAWPESNYLDPDNAPTIVNNFGSGVPMGIIGRRMRGINTTFLAEASMGIPTGLGVAVITAADLWLVNRGTTQALIGQKAYANFADGSASFAATGTPTTGASSSSTGSLAPVTNAITASISGNVLNVTVAASAVYVGATITTGAGVASGSQIVSQLSGTAGGVGTYALNIGEQSVASESMVLSHTLFTAGTVTLGTFGVGDVLTGTGVTAGSIVTALITGGGTGGTMVVSPYGQTVSGQVISVSALNADSRFYAQSSGAVGELVKVSALPGAVGA